MNSLPTKVRTAWALGPMSLSRVAAYRLGLRAGRHPVLSITARIPPGPYFLTASASPVNAPSRLVDSITYFGWKQAPLDEGRPDWFRSPFSTEAAPNSGLPWWKISDFDPAVGDIKTIWEASRFGWALDHARAARNGDAAGLRRLNDWLTDWVNANPAYQGHNWKCGQETSIRVMHLAASALVLGSAKDLSPALAKLLEAHLLRIAPTISYAIGQDNNHGTSEAAALFIGGDWLAGSHPQAQRWHTRGRALLEDRARRLITEDGTFSQYSVTYHRLMLDTYALAEIWRRRHALPEFSETLRKRLAAAARWLRELVDRQSGDAPNLGANDGAHILRLTDGDYRDFRPSVQLATALFEGTRAFEGDGEWNQPFAWLGVDLPALPAQPPSSRLLDDGGLALLRDRRNLAVLRYPRFRFRPSQADALHVDFWRDGQNLLRDGGSYSYADAEWNAYFAGTRSHNTVEFDGRDQMPRLGRFLFGDWLATESVSGPKPDADRQTVAASYRDRTGARHVRRVELAPNRLVVIDDIEGLRKKAVLRWRLQPGEWRIDGSTVTDGRTRLSIEASMPIDRIEIVPGWEARYYLQKSKLPVLEVEIGSAGRLTSGFEFGA